MSVQSSDTSADLTIQELHLQRVLEEMEEGERLFELEMFQRAVFALWRLQTLRLH